MWYWAHRTLTTARDRAAVVGKEAVDQFAKQMEMAAKKGQFGLQRPVVPAPVVGEMVFKQDDRLTGAEPPDNKHKRPSKTYNVRMQAGRTYQLDMVSGDMDPFLRLEDANGKELAEDDDGGDNLNARIIFACPADGEYRVIAQNLWPGPGSFTLTLQQQR
jgi:hypothetical protein